VRNVREVGLIRPCTVNQIGNDDETACRKTVVAFLNESRGLTFGSGPATASKTAYGNGNQGVELAFRLAHQCLRSAFSAFMPCEKETA